MLKPEFISILSEKITSELPSKLTELHKETQLIIEKVLESQLSQLEIVTREEFLAQAAVLAKTRSKIEELERKITEIERTHNK